MVRLQRSLDTSKRLEASTEKMVSTRGVKFKFSEGEKVLCYEPDPTKAKVLYESKVLELVVSRDNRGRKAAEYLIHFYGWNSSWDRCVSEDFILPDTEENRNLQKRLAEDAAQKLKGCRRRKLPAIIKESLKKKQCTSNGKENNRTKESEESSSSEGESGKEEEVEKSVNISIPTSLKKILEQDCFLITQKNKLIKLPCEITVVSILEAYVKHLAVNLLCASPPKKNKHDEKACVIPADVENSIQLCQEVMDGLRIYFDFTLPHLLLYRQERKQYSTVISTCRPVMNIKSEVPTDHDNEEKPDPKELTSPLSPVTSEFPTSKEGSLPTTPPFSPTRSRPPRHQVNSLTLMHSTANAENGVTLNSSPKYKTEPPQQEEKSVLSERRILRSAEKRLTNTTTNIVSGVNKAKESVDVDSATKCETVVHHSTPIRQSRSSTKHVPLHLQLSSNHNSSLARTSLPQRVSSPPALNIATISNISSSSSSTHSTASSPAFGGSAHHIVKASEVLSEVLSWKMLPPQLYESVPASPSLLYGSQHLLRLFVKLPELIHRMNLPNRKLVPLLDYINGFLQYLADRKEELFPKSAYIDSDDSCMPHSTS